MERLGVARMAAAEAALDVEAGEEPGDVAGAAWTRVLSESSSERFDIAFSFSLSSSRSRSSESISALYEHSLESKSLHEKEGQAHVRYTFNEKRNRTRTMFVLVLYYMCTHFCFF